MKIEWEDVKNQLLDWNCQTLCFKEKACPDHHCPVWLLLEVCDKSPKLKD
jgi:hypothetical protein